MPSLVGKWLGGACSLLAPFAHQAGAAYSGKLERPSLLWEPHFTPRFLQQEKIQVNCFTQRYICNPWTGSWTDNLESHSPKSSGCVQVTASVLPIDCTLMILKWIQVYWCCVPLFMFCSCQGGKKLRSEPLAGPRLDHSRLTDRQRERAAGLSPGVWELRHVSRLLCVDALSLALRDDRSLHPLVRHQAASVTVDKAAGERQTQSRRQTDEDSTN